MLKIKAGEIIGSGSPQKIIRRGDLKAVTGYSVGHIYALIADGKFPRPVTLGPRAVGWLESEIVAWQRDRIAARDGAADAPPRAA